MYNIVQSHEEFVHYFGGMLLKHVAWGLNANSKYICFQIKTDIGNRMTEAFQEVLIMTTSLTRRALQNDTFRIASDGVSYFKLAIGMYSAQCIDECFTIWFSQIQNCKNFYNLKPELQDVMMAGAAQYLLSQQEYFRDECLLRGLINENARFCAFVNR